MVGEGTAGGKERGVKFFRRMYSMAGGRSGYFQFTFKNKSVLLSLIIMIIICFFSFSSATKTSDTCSFSWVSFKRRNGRFSLVIIVSLFSCSI